MLGLVHRQRPYRVPVFPQAARLLSIRRDLHWCELQSQEPWWTRSVLRVGSAYRMGSKRVRPEFPHFHAGPTTPTISGVDGFLEMVLPLRIGPVEQKGLCPTGSLDWGSSVRRKASSDDKHWRAAFWLSASVQHTATAQRECREFAGRPWSMPDVAGHSGRSSGVFEEAPLSRSNGTVHAEFSTEADWWKGWRYPHRARRECDPVPSGVDPRLARSYSGPQVGRCAR